MPGVSTSVLRAILRAVADGGGAPHDMLQRAGIDPALAQDVDARVTCERVFQLTEIAADALGDPHFGLTLGGAFQPNMLGVLGHLTLAAPTPRQALESYVTFQHAIGDGFQIALRPYPGVTAVVVNQHPALTRGASRHNVEAVLAGLHLALTRPGPAAPLRPSVRMRHRMQPPADAYRRIFGDDVQFGTGHDALVYADRVLDQRSWGGQPELFAWLATRTRGTLARRGGDGPVADQVRRVATLTLRAERPTLARCAAELHSSPRALQRRLKAEGTSFQAVLDDVRRDVAEAHLAESELSVTELARLLGFRDDSAFRKACRRWFGGPPAVRRGPGD